MSEPKVITAARAMLRGYYNCEPLPMLAEQLADALAEWRPAGETPIDAELLAETQRCLREAIAENERLRAALTEQDQLRGATEMIDEPVAYMYTYHGPEGWGDRLEFPGARWQGPGYNHMPNNWRETPLYVAPPRRKWVPLTEPEMHTLDWPHSWQYDDVRAFCESVEAKLREMNS